MQKRSNYISILLLFSILLLCGGIYGQDTEADFSYKDYRKATAGEHIKQLKNGALLVRLKTKNRSIDAMMSKGMTKQAEALEQKILEENLEIVNAFRARFSFCPVYFFYSNDSKYVINGTLDSIVFLNDQLEPDGSIKFSEEGYLTAEFTLLSQNNTKQQNIAKGQENNPNNRNEAKYYGGANMRFHALIIKDQEFTQLQRPFPYYTRTLNSFFLKRKMEEVVAIMNENLFMFYDERKDKD